MIRRTVLCAFATTWLCGAPAASAQSDTQVWLEAGGSVELHDDIDLDLSQHLRFDDDVSQVSSVMPEAGLSFELADFFELGAGYRYEYERKGGGFESGHRVNLDGETAYDVGVLRLGYRLRYQEKFQDGDDPEKLRNQVEIELRGMDWWKPALQAEVYHELEDSEIQWEKTRFTGGVELERGDHEVELFYRIQIPRDTMDPIEHIVGLGLKTELYER